MPPDPFPCPPISVDAGESAGAGEDGDEGATDVGAGAGAPPPIIAPAQPIGASPLLLFGSVIRTIIRYDVGKVAGTGASTTVRNLTPAGDGHLIKSQVLTPKGVPINVLPLLVKIPTLSSRK